MDDHLRRRLYEAIEDFDDPPLDEDSLDELIRELDKEERNTLGDINRVNQVESFLKGLYDHSERELKGYMDELAECNPNYQKAMERAFKSFARMEKTVVLAEKLLRVNPLHPGKDYKEEHAILRDYRQRMEFLVRRPDKYDELLGNHELMLEAVKVQDYKGAAMYRDRNNTILNGASVS